MVSRYREEAANHGFGLVALRRTLETSGRTILFSSLTVAAAIASLAIFPQRFLYSMGIAGALVALIAAALALLGAAGAAGRARPARQRARAEAAAARRRPRRATGRVGLLVPAVAVRDAPPRAGSRIAQPRLLIALGIPFFASIKFLPVDASVLPPSASARQVDDALRTQFPPGRTAPARGR